MPDSVIGLSPRDAYLWLLKRCLTDLIHEGAGHKGLFDADIRRIGRDWPERGHTMVGLDRLDNLQWCITRVLAEGIPGDLIETGVWRGGATILMRAVLQAYGVEDRDVWVADSFEGVPPSDAVHFPQDEYLKLETYQELKVSLAEVRRNFERYGLLDEHVRFLPGLFKDTLASAPIQRLAVLRLDGDLYESTIQTLDALYDRVSPGGFVIVDDYGAIQACKQATDDYRAAHGIGDAITQIDWTGVWWRKSRP